MPAWETARLALTCGALCGVTSSAVAQSVSDYAVRVSAAVQTNPPQIRLSWPADSGATGYTVCRKLRDDSSWGSGTMLAANATNHVDSNVVVGSAYEYEVSKSASTYGGEGYIYAGIQTPLADSRGKVVLVVDNTLTSSLALELARLQQDFVGDGWTVLRHDVPRMVVDPANTSSNVWDARSNELASVKALITADYNADPANVRAVFLFGHVPVPYSGKTAPDGHSDHLGAWPADLYYGDMSGLWTDSKWNTTTASDTRNWNVRGDGKFDQSVLPGIMTLEVGRVDLANLPAFPQSETELLRQYLNKDHGFRHKLVTAQGRGWIDDHFGVSGASAPVAVNGWRNFAPFFGASNTFAGLDWLGTLATNSYLWGYACAGGNYAGSITPSDIATTALLATNDPRVVFTMFFGSYFGDWDSQNNFLRASLATTNYTLTSAWVGRPYWQFHHMALGETIGFSTRLSQNNDGTLYSVNLDAQGVHIALMGDPTLRMHVVAPPSALVAATNTSGGVDLSWNPSPETVLGYHVYRGPTAAGPFVRLTTGLITATNYTGPVVTKCTYMVRAVKLEVGGSGSYYNASQGIFQEIAPPAAPQMLVITARSASKVYGEPLPDLIAFYSGFVNGDTTNSLTSQALLSTPATADSPVGNYPIHVSGAAGTNYAITFVDGTLTILPAATTSLLTSSPNPSLPGQPVTFTFTIEVVPPGAGTLTGTVQFKTDGTNAGAPVSLSGGTVNCTNSTLEHGWHSVEAEYTGDGNFTVSPGFVSQLVNTAPEAGPDTLEREPTNGVTVAIATLLTNDWDPDDDPIMFFDVDTTSANGGTLVSDGETIVYTPATGFTGADAFHYTIMDTYGATAVGTVAVDVPGNGPPANLSISNLAGDWYAISGSNSPGRTNRILFVEDLASTNWQALGTATADSSGIFQFIDTNITTQRFYRSVYP